MTTVTIPGRPVPKARPRVGRSGRVYTPEATANYEGLIKVFARQAFRKPLEGRVELRVRVYLNGERRGDLDNYVKAVSDGLNGIAFKDDRQVAHIEAWIEPCGKRDERLEFEVVGI